jgi:hypothetical protein
LWPIIKNDRDYNEKITTTVCIFLFVTVGQHLTKLEKYLESQQGEGINKLHYKDLLLRVKKIREKFETGK